MLDERRHSIEASSGLCRDLSRVGRGRRPLSGTGIACSGRLEWVILQFDFEVLGSLLLCFCGSAF